MTAVARMAIVPVVAVRQARQSLVPRPGRPWLPPVFQTPQAEAARAVASEPQGRDAPRPPLASVQSYQSQSAQADVTLVRPSVGFGPRSMR